MIRIHRIQYSLLRRRKPRNDASICTMAVVSHGIRRSPNLPKLCSHLWNQQQLRQYQTTKIVESLFVRSNSFNESSPHLFDGEQNASIDLESTNDRTTSRLDFVPNDLCVVVEKVLTYLELNHEDRLTRERYAYNLEHARRFPVDDTDRYRGDQEDNPGGTKLNHVNGNDAYLNGHHLSFNEIVSDLSTMNDNSRMDISNEDFVRDINGYDNSTNDETTAMLSRERFTTKNTDDLSTHIGSKSFSKMEHENTYPATGYPEGLSGHRPRDEALYSVGTSELSPFDSIRAQYSRELILRDVRDINSVNGETAIYHGLKNDYESGGQIEEVVKLTSKSDPKPFASIDTALAGPENVKVIADREEHGSGNSDDSDVPRDHFKESESPDVGRSGFVDRFLLRNVSRQMEQSFSPNDGFAVNEFDTRCEAKISASRQLDEPQSVDDNFSLHSQITSHKVNGYSQLPLPDDCSLVVNGTLSLHNQITGRKVNGSSQLPLPDDCSLDIGVGTIQKSISDSLLASKPAEDESLLSWFQSDFLERDNDIDFRSHFKAENISKAEQSRRDGVTEAVVLLRTLTEDQWICFDLGDTTTVSLTDDAFRNDLDHGEAEQCDIRRTVDVLSDLLSTDILPGGAQLTTAEYNFSLARIAIATDVAPDDILALLMQTHNQMNELASAGFPECQPNAVTHEILLLALVRRFSAFYNAIDLVMTLSKSPRFSWTSKTLQAASELCERKDLLRMSRDMMDDLQKKNVTSFRIPKRVFINLINVYKDNDARQDAIEMLRLGLKQAMGRTDKHLDEVFVHTIRWPTRSRLAGFIDNSSVIADILSLLENETIYVAGLPVWKELIKASSLGASKIPMRWEYVVKSFHYLSVADPTYWPDHLLLRQGLTASDALVNADLAWDLLRRAIRNYNPGLLRTIKNPLYRRPHVPYQDFVSGIMTCVKASDMNSCEKILSVANTMHMTPTNIRSLYVLALKGYAHAGDATKAIKVLDSMKAEKLKPGEDCFGALFYAYAMSHQLDAARKLLQEMESGTFDVSPGPTCYDGFILACARNRAWSDILSAYEQMKLLNVPVSSASSHGILLAAVKNGNRAEVKAFVESFVASNAQLYGDGALLALRILLDNIIHRNDDTDELSLDTIRERLRILSHHSPTLQSECLRLIRSLRMAESEESRHLGLDTGENEKRNSILPLREIFDRRHIAWHTMLTDLLALVDAVKISSEHYEEDGCTVANIID